MSPGLSLPWPRINDFLAEAGAAKNDQEFIHFVIQHIEKLVPYDLNGVFVVIDPKGLLCPSQTVFKSEKLVDCFLDYYWRLIPDVSKEMGRATKTVDWSHYRNSEYVADFLTPQHVRYSIGVPSLGKGHIGTLALNRSKASPHFNEREQQTLEILQPHLSNLFRIFTQTPPQDPFIPGANELASNYGALSKREAEIAAFLYLRYSTGMIGSKLTLSKATVYKHIEHIFAKLNVSKRKDLVAKIRADFALNAEGYDAKKTI